MSGNGFPFTRPGYQYVIFFSILNKPHEVYIGAPDEATAIEYAERHVDYYPCGYFAKYYIKEKADCTEKELDKITLLRGNIMSEKKKYCITITHVWINVTVDAESGQEAMQLVQDGYWDFATNAEICYDDAEYHDETEEQS